MNQRERGREIEVVGSKAREVELSIPFDIGHGATGFAICSAGFQSCYGLLFAHFWILWHSMAFIICFSM